MMGVAVLKHHAVLPPHVHAKAPDIKSCCIAHCITRPLLPRHIIGLCKSGHPWECVSDSQAINKLPDVEPILHMYMCKLDELQWCGDTLVLIHCIATAVCKNLYTTCMYVAHRQFTARPKAA